MQADLILCDHAESVNGKLYINGGGWNVIFTGGRPATFSLAVVLTVDWNETNTPHLIVADLRTEDGDPVEPTEPGHPVRVEARMEMGRPPGVKPGSELVATMAFLIQNLPLPVGTYVWHLNLGDQELARRPFTVTNPPQIPGFRGPMP